MSRAIPCLFCLAASLLLTSAASAGQLRPPVAEPATTTPPAEIVGQPDYGSLVMLIGKVCSESGNSFAGFFDSSPVRVPSFIHLGRLNGNSSLLGVLLADQMAAVLNGHANAFHGKGDDEGQILEGILQEVDGYLRIHMLGRNRQQQRRSHVAVIEMSTALYRALHSRVDSE